MSRYTIEQIRMWLRKYGAPTYLYQHLTEGNMNAANPVPPESSLIPPKRFNRYINVPDQQQWQEMNLDEKMAYANPEYAGYLRQQTDLDQEEKDWLTRYEEFVKVPSHMRWHV